MPPRLCPRLLGLSRLSFYALLFMLPVSVRWVLVAHSAYGLHPEYLNALFYLIDLPLLVTLGAWLLALALDQNYTLNFFVRPITLLLGMLAGLSVVSVAWALATPVAATFAINLALLFVLYLYIQNEIRDHRPVALALGSSAAIQALLALLQFILQTPVGLYALGEIKLFTQMPGASIIQVGLEKWRRSYGLYPSPNMLGDFLAVGLLAWLGWTISRRTSKWAGWLSLAALMVLGLLCSFSRAAWLGWGIGFGGLGLSVLKSPRLRRAYWRLAAAGAGVALAFVAAYPSLFVTRLVAPLTAQATAAPSPAALEKLDLAQREAYERLAWEVIIHYPGLGAGIGNSPLAASFLSQPRLGETSHEPVHNLALLLTAELGPLGGLIWVSLWGTFLVGLWQNRHRLTASPWLIIWSGAVAALGVISCFDHSLFTYQQSRVLLWSTWGLWASAAGQRLQWRWPELPSAPLPTRLLNPARPAGRWFMLLLPVLGLTGWGIYHWLLQPRGPFFWDPAGFAVAGLNTLRLFQAQHWPALFQALGQQLTYPPAQPVLLAMFMGLAGVSETTVRLFSLLCLLGSAGLIYRLASQLNAPAPYSALAGWLAVALWLTGATTLFWASEATLEAPGAFFTLVACAGYFQFTRQRRLRWLGLTGLAVTLVLFIKYNYALPLLGGVWIITLFSQTTWGQRLRQLAILAATTLLLPLIWFLTDPVPRLGALLDFAINRSSGMGIVENMLFYPQALLLDYAGHWLVGGALLFAAVYWVYRRGTDPRVQFLALVGLLGLGLASLHPYKQARFIYPLLPLLVSLGSAGLSAFLVRWAPLPRPRRSVLAGLLLVGLLVGLTLPGRLQQYQRGVNERLNYDPADRQTVTEMLDFVQTQTNPSQGVLVNGWFNEFSDSLLRWTWLKQGQTALRLYGLPYPGEAGRQGRPVGDAAAYATLLATYLHSQRPAWVVSIVVGPDSHFYTPDYKNWNAWQSAYDTAMQQNPELQLHQTAWFADRTIRVRVYTYRHTSLTLAGWLPTDGP